MGGPIAVDQDLPRRMPVSPGIRSHSQQPDRLLNRDELMQFGHSDPSGGVPCKRGITKLTKPRPRLKAANHPPGIRSIVAPPLGSYNNPMIPTPNELFRKIPSVEALIEAAEARFLPGEFPRAVIVAAVRSAVASARDLLQTAAAPAAEAIGELIQADVQRRLKATLQPRYRKAINATGIILHTGLGRAVLPQAALRQICDQLSGYSVLQIDVDGGQRGSREERIEELLRLLVGADAATVVNNNAAATAVVLNTVAAGREVIVSRGQLVEIGGSFRLPDVMAAAGAQLVEVGTTNKTHLRDYQRAIGDRTAAILRVHPSNYKIVGFTAEVPLEGLVQLGRAHGLAVIDDVGAGPLIDFSQFGFEKEPTLAESVAAGADVITSSGDKLIGGPQAGIILGKSPWIEAIRKNPLARMVRPDKLTLAALEATLTLFLDPERALAEVPTLRMLRRDLADITAQAQRIAAAICRSVPAAKATAVEGFSQMGSGSLPGQNLPTSLVAVQAEDTGEGEIARRLRQNDPPVFTRVGQGRVLADPRTLQDGEESLLVAAFCRALGAKE
jgi:L-seryl-tRNA(Ser) seleniumtransferase